MLNVQQTLNVSERYAKWKQNEDVTQKLTGESFQTSAAR